MKFGEEIKVTICRYDPERDSKPHYETYTVPDKEGLTILEVLQYVYENYDGSLAFYHNCKFGLCGSCAVMVNGRPTLICKSVAPKEMVIEPLSNFPVIKDLVINRSSFQRARLKVKPYLIRVAPSQLGVETLRPKDFEIYRVLSRCVRCLGCVSTCPVVTTNKYEYSGPAVMVELARYMFDPRDVDDRTGTAYISGIHNCAGCGQCKDVCPYDIPISDVIKNMKPKLFEKKLYPFELKEVISRLKMTGNVYRLETRRAVWSGPIKSIVRNRIGRKAKTAYFVGCLSSSSPRCLSIPRSFIWILEKLDLNYTLLPQEWCCGYPLFSYGAIELGKTFMKKNIENLQKLGVEEVVVTCAGCHRTFKKTYPELTGNDLPFEVLQSSEMLAKLIDDAMMRLRTKIERSVTYHDSCELGRGCGMYEEPRKVLESMHGLKFIELPKNRRNSVCCGGTVKVTNPDLALRMAYNKLEEVRSVSVETVISGCPACKLNMWDANAKSAAKLEILDIVEVVAKALEEGSASNISNNTR